MDTNFISVSSKDVKHLKKLLAMPLKVSRNVGGYFPCISYSEGLCVKWGYCITVPCLQVIPSNYVK